MSNTTLNEFGLMIWNNKYFPDLQIQKSYNWSTRLLFTNRNQVYDIQNVEGFDFSGWRPVTVEEYKEMIRPKG